MTRSARWSLVLAAGAALAPVTARADDPAIRLKLNDEVFAPGERAKVRVKLAADGYLVVLRADAQGRVRVLFPLDPADSTLVRAGKEFVLRGRGERDGFMVDDRDGSGVVLAARSAAPFDFQAFTRGAHWDYRALAASDSAAPDGEATLLDVIDRMAGGDYDYDVVTYTVSERAYGHRYAGGWHGPMWPRPWFGPIWYGPTWYGPGWGRSRIWIGGGFAFGPRYVGRRWR